MWLIQAQGYLSHAEVEQCPHGGRVKEGLAAAVAEVGACQGLPRGCGIFTLLSEPQKMLKSSGIMTKNVRRWLNPVGCGSPAGLGQEAASCTAQPLQLCADSRSSRGTWLHGGVWIRGPHIAYGSKGLTGGQTSPGGDPEQDILVLAPVSYTFASPSPPLREDTEKATGRRRIWGKQPEIPVMSYTASPDGASPASSYHHNMPAWIPRLVPGSSSQHLHKNTGSVSGSSERCGRPSQPPLLDTEELEKTGESHPDCNAGT